jgi:segregation and condensation protein B
MSETLEETMTDAMGEDETQPESEAEASGSAGEGRAEITTESVVEAILFATEEPLSAKKIAGLLGTGTAKDVKQQIEALNEGYAAQNRSFRIEEIAGGFQMLTLPDYNTWLSKYREVRSESKLSQAALETLAIVAYKQPVLRAEVEVIRGVAAGDMLNRLREMGLIKIVGRAEELGRPMLYGTTKRFLEVFGLAGLDDLPQIEELKAPE